MLRLVALLLVCAPALASADKSYMDGKGGTWDCGKDPVVSIMANEGTYTLKGACKSINVMGNKNKVAVDSAAEINVNGNENMVAAVAVDAINANGNKNSVTYKKAVADKGKTAVKNPGTDNKVSQSK